MKMLGAISRPKTAAPIIETLDLDEPRAGEVLVRLVATGICHTDITVHGRAMEGGIVLGHEGAGVIERVGPGVSCLKPGDHVVLSYSFCGHCAPCLRGDHSYCDEVMARNFGGLRADSTSALSLNGKPVMARFFGQSSFAQYAIAEEGSVVKVGKDVPLELLGPLACGLMTGAGAVLNAFKLRPGQSIAVFGAGSVGLAAVMAARIAGASRIIAIDKVGSRLEMARELGATETIEPARGDSAAAVRALSPGGVDFSLNTTTAPAIFSAALDCLAQQGTMGVVTSSTETPWTPDMGAFLRGGRRMRAILMGDATPTTFIPLLIDFYRQGRFPFDKIIKFYPFEEIAQAFADSEAGKTIKPVLRMPSS